MDIAGVAIVCVAVVADVVIACDDIAGGDIEDVAIVAVRGVCFEP